MVNEEDCIFCKIVGGEVPCAKVWEDEEHLAFLDINPNTKGMTLVIPKKHFDSYVIDMEGEDYCKLMIATKKVAKLLDKKLNVKRTAIVMEGLGVNHAHIKLYPIYGLEEKFEEIWANEKVFFDKYVGYITTQLGPKVDIKDLDNLAKEIKK
jgi:diadenosine tetraphosphate (Ap4A) HIT family hydrolase